MALRSTYSAPRRAHYLQPGGPWDVPILDELFRLSPVTAGPAVVDGSRRIDARELEDAVAGLAGSLKKLGIRRGDVVSWQLPNWFEAIVLYRACWRLGATAAPFHHQMGGKEVTAMIESVQPKVLLSTASMPLSEIGNVLKVRGEGSVFEELMHGRAVTTSPSKGTDVAAVIFTSGSTGRPKAVMHSQRGLAYKARSMSHVHGLGQGDAVLMPAPLAHISGLLNAVLVPGAAGMKVVLMERWSVDEGIELMASEAVTYMIGPPLMFDAIMDAPSFSREKVAAMRVISSGMMGVRPTFIERAHREMGAVVKRSYGSTEAPTVSTCRNDDPQERCEETDGRAQGATEIKVVDPSSHRLRKPGVEGEVWIRGPELFTGYIDEQETRDAIHRGWFRSGDLGVLRDGWLVITGRIKDLIIRGGENISATEVEQALEQHPDVTHAVVVGRDHERLGEQVVAFVVTTEPFELSTCQAWFAEIGVARFKTPEFIVLLEEIPLLPAGKPDRSALKALAARLPAS